MSCLKLAIMIAPLLVLGCARQQPAAPGQAPSRQVAPPAAVALPPAQLHKAPDDGERIRAGQLVQKVYAASHGPVHIAAISLESGVFRVQVAPTAQGATPFDVYLTRDLRLLFPAARDPAAVLQVSALDREFGECLRAKGLRVYGDPQQAQTQRQMAELGAHASRVLVNCAATPADCAALGQTSLPLVMFGVQKVASLVPRAVIVQWTGCGPKLAN